MPWWWVIWLQYCPQTALCGSGHFEGHRLGQKQENQTENTAFHQHTPCNENESRKGLYSAENILSFIAESPYMCSLYKTRSTSSLSDLCLKGLTDPASTSPPAAPGTNSDVSMWASRNQIFTASTFFPCPTAVQTSRVKMRRDNLTHL